ncbi:hypothetical protein Ciccas_008663 [Cichlidogyrus casuarinus]|uniref:Uncharacterized protein n=1 Tax=Cichlidogyrus casuarinus TaxID=1844966 RepID=A0ABD2PZF5_9PLAT
MHSTAGRGRETARSGSSRSRLHRRLDWRNTKNAKPIPLRRVFKEKVDPTIQGFIDKASKVFLEQPTGYDVLSTKSCTRLCHETPLKGNLLHARLNCKLSDSLYSYSINRYSLEEFPEDIPLNQHSRYVFISSEITSLLKSILICWRARTLISPNMVSFRFIKGSKSIEGTLARVMTQHRGFSLEILPLVHAVTGGDLTPHFKTITKESYAEALLIDSTRKKLENGLELEEFDVKYLTEVLVAVCPYRIRVI